MLEIFRITITIDTPAGPGPIDARVDQASPEPYRPGEGSSGVAGPPPSASGDVPVEGIAPPTHTGAEALRMLKAAGFDNPAQALLDYNVDFIVRVCEACRRQGARVRDPGAWIRRALQKKYRNL